jgi:pseudaminic acid cytidylyltransferase
MLKKNKNICIIPARAGSKRIPNKNIKKFLGKPLISYSIKIAKKSKLFHKIFVSTDSKLIKKISEMYGAEVPFLREKKFSKDGIGTEFVTKNFLKKINYKSYDYCVCLYPTSPFLKISDLYLSLKKIKKNNFDKLTSVGKYNFSPLRAFKQINNKISFLNNKYKNIRSQKLPNILHDAGNFYIYKIKNFLTSKKTQKKHTFFELDSYRVLDINTLEDFKMAEIQYEILKKKKLI